MPQSPSDASPSDSHTAPDESVHLLGQDDPPPVRLHAPLAASPFLLVSDHAGRRVPAMLGGMGVSAADWDRHIAWDIGIAGVCAPLAGLLGATLIEQVYSRLVVDCNRRPGHPTSMPTVSDGTLIPANRNVPLAQAQARIDSIFHPYHDRIAAELKRRRAIGQPTILLAMHSFTPVMAGISRPWHAGVLFNRSPALSLAVAARLRAAGFCVGENEPYVLSDESDYTVPVHAEAHGLPYLELELRQDLIAGPAGQQAWARRLAAMLPEAAADLNAS